MMKRFFHTTRNNIITMKRLMLNIILLATAATAWAAPIGTWKAYMAYHEVKDVKQAGNILYVLASNGLYTYNTADNSIQTYDKVNGMSDCIIKYIDWCAAAKSLAVIYDNGNIDIMDNKGNIINIPDYMNKSMTEDKTIYGIDIDGKHAYLSTAFGIIKINVADAEISDTYKLGFRVDYCYTEGGKIYAASSTKGIYSADMTTNLLDPANWTYTKPYTGKDKSPDPELVEKVKTLNPGGPKYNTFGYLDYANGKLYTCGRNTNILDPACIQILENDEWTIYQDEGISEKTGLRYSGIEVMDHDPRDPLHVFAAGRNGVYEFYDGKFKAFYNSDNSPIESFNNKDKEYELIFGLKFDTKGNLWMLNSQAPTQSLIEYSAGGEWISHKKQELMKLDDGGFTNKSVGYLKDIMFDSRGLMWFVNDHPSHQIIACYQPETDQIKAFSGSFFNQDGTNLGLQNIRCITEDLDGNIWVGTNAGPFYMTTSQINSDQNILTQFKVPRNDGTNFADYLLAGVDITSMAIDAAGRKWFGTNGSGVYLISRDNIEQLQHFTTSNSSLLSDNIIKISINHDTGEVFFATENGLCSYMSDATTASDDMDKDNVYAYPNPVKPDFNGTITIVGLSMDADVKITTSNGTLVNQGRSNGGLYSWDGCDLDGRRVASGVYMVQTATSDGSKGTVCKIAVIN